MCPRPIFGQVGEYFFGCWGVHKSILFVKIAIPLKRVEEVPDRIDGGMIQKGVLAEIDAADVHGRGGQPAANGNK